MDVPIRRVIRMLDTYTHTKNKDGFLLAKCNLEGLQYRIQVVQRYNINTERAGTFSSKKSNVNEHKDVIDIENILDKENKNSEENREDFCLPDIFSGMLPSIQTAVDHFRKTMKRTTGSYVHLPPLSKSYDDNPMEHPRRMKYKHRTTEEAIKNSENYDRLQYILREENVSNSIDQVFEANKPLKAQKSRLESLECSPPLISFSFSQDIILDNEKELKNHIKCEEKSCEKQHEGIFIDPTESNLTEKIEPTRYELFRNANASEIIENVTNIQIKATTKELVVSVPKEEKPLKKKVRFNLDPNIHKNTYVTALKTSRLRDKRHEITTSYTFSYFNDMKTPQRKIKKRVGMKQIFKGQHPDKYYRPQRC